MIWIFSSVLLEIRENASNDQITEAYKRMMKIYHPDINKHPAATEMTKSINEAYDNMLNHYPYKVISIKIDDEKYYSIMKVN